MSGNYAVDLTKYHFKRELGDITLYGTWVPNLDKEDTEPALVMVPRFRYGAIPCGVALSAAYLYNDPRYLVRAAHQFCKDLGFEPGLSTTNRIAMIIHDHLDDLVSMPPEPGKSIIVADATLTHASGKKETFELLDFDRTI